MCCLGQNLWLVGQALFSNFNKSSPTDGLRIIVVTFVVIACRFPFARLLRHRRLDWLDQEVLQSGVPSCSGIRKQQAVPCLVRTAI